MRRTAWLDREHTGMKVGGDREHKGMQVGEDAREESENADARGSSSPRAVETKLTYTGNAGFDTHEYQNAAREAKEY